MPLDRIIKVFTSLRLTVACLALALVLVFLGTLAQEPLGLYAVQQRFFRSFFVDASALGAALHKLADMIMQGFGHPLAPLNAHEVLSKPRIPIFPGGYLIGGVLLINLIAAHWQRFQFSWKKSGIIMAHFGVILLLLGQLMTDLLSEESTLHLREGQTKNYSETERQAELAIIDTSDADSDKVVAVPQQSLMEQGEIRHAVLPFTVNVKRYLANSVIENRDDDSKEAPPGTQGFGPRLKVTEVPRVTVMDKRDVPSAIVEVVTPKGALGTWLVSEYLDRPQSFTVEGRAYQLALRPKRHYKPFSMQLLDFRHEIYKGTDIPKDFSSRVALNRPDSGEKREVLIYMNSPLRYAGETFYQASFDPDDKGSVFQVVCNPSWLTPYFSCVLVGAGLIVQFMLHLVPFIKRRMA
jgi:hypothetical protein